MSMSGRRFFFTAQVVFCLMTTNHSDLTMERYHALSDTTMDTLLESLELLLDDLGNPGYELEYHVRIQYLRQ
jgi:hypothetical protein